ncbi:hypothetical protein KPH14_003530 [Odynerus spinipes]|uniref:Secreted protein n=1 Tax=Odynerus spinipes TaxID=1348599 RepID=A0AAD9RCV0_9HYME|nr:hypothetical protein KPH14_003530 [Odynerus spinipes]
MIKIGIVLAVLAVAAANARVAVRFLDEARDSSWRLVDRRARAADPTEVAIIEILRKISSGQADARDDEELVERIKEVIVTTASRIRAPNGSIEGLARRAQYLVSELTSAYTNAIYRSKNIDEARRNFARFQYTVQRIVDFTKSGRFVAG